jgi:hypothetical protein
MSLEDCPTFEEVIASKKLSNENLVIELMKLRKYSADENKRCFVGNPILYHFQLENLCRTKVKTGSFKDMMDDDEKRARCWENCNKYAKNSRPNNAPLRLFEIWRRMSGAVVFFKPSTAKFLYKKFNATAVLDPTAGWGGRMLGAYALDIAYTGIDTNTALKPAYDGMMALMNKPGLNMIWESCLDVDFSKIDYDFVLTSPPYINLEVYENMTPFESNKIFYEKFLIPLIDKCRKFIRRNGYVCFNISPKMYRDLLKHGYKECDIQYDLLQQKVQGKDKGDKIYCWKA